VINRRELLRTSLLGIVGGILFGISLPPAEQKSAWEYNDGTGRWLPATSDGGAFVAQDDWRPVVLDGDDTPRYWVRFRIPEGAIL